MAAGSEMRVGDAEREAAAAELREHFASGRLTQDELNERLDQCFAAKTRGDLNAPFTDLPSARAGWGAAAGAGATGTGWNAGGRGGFGPSQPFGAGGPYGTSGPFGGSGQFGPPRPGRGPADAVGALLVGTFALFALVFMGMAWAFSVGAQPLGVVLIFAAFALLRRLFFLVFRRRRMGRGRGSRRRF